MPSWHDFERQAPELAAYGRGRLSSGVAYLATVRPDGGPRVHPVTPIIGDELYLFMEPTSPKGKDLVRDGRFALHCAVEDMSGGEGEFYVRGHGRLSVDPTHRTAATRAAAYEPRPDYILFVLGVEFAFMNQYGEGENTVSRWPVSP